MSAPLAQSYALLSIAAAVVTIALKMWAYLVTGSVGLLSDAVESFVNLLAAVVAYWALRVAARPPDDDHAFGHTKAEYFSSGFEGFMILAAATAIAYTAIERLQKPEPVGQVPLGIAISVAASVVNGGVAWVLMRASRRLRSITLRADAHHLLTDVWTSVGVIVGVLLIPLTGWLILDPLIALLVAANIVFTGLRLLVETGHGLLDRAVSPEDRQTLARVLAPIQARGIAIHALRTRIAGRRRFVEMHVLVPGLWTVKQAHDLSEEIELAVLDALPESTVTTHMEPIEDPASWDDQGLDRAPRPTG